jgi:uncharacterized protein (TIGR02145 family)
MDTRNICPCGWHVPSEAEWQQLTTFLGGESVAGGKMKSTGTQYWESPNTGATNESGFSGLPGGYRGTEISDSQFGALGTYCNWWTTTEHVSYAWVHYLYYNNNQAAWYNSILGRGHSVRCVKN